MQDDHRPVLREILGAVGECGDTAFIADLFAQAPDGWHGAALWPAPRRGGGWRAGLRRWAPALAFRPRQSA
jgi:hypothetical protein